MSRADVSVAAVTEQQLEEALSLIASYQRFYGAKRPSTERNRAFFAGFLNPSPRGLLMGVWSEQQLAGFACLYWTFSSVRTTDVVLLNDLFVRSEQRGRGLGLALIDATVNVARERGVPLVRWWTQLDNERAQRLYERTGASRSRWFEYEIAT